ncbi:MAG: XdhC family protein [Neptuniibacter sp.]
MANQLSALLEHWYPQRDGCDWVLGTVYKTEGPCYRKAGAMMLFNSLGQQFGMLSGGCLESDIQTHARKVMQTGQSISLCYDGSDEDDLAFHLGIGCGGTVYIMLHPVNAANNYQDLEVLKDALSQRQTVRYCQQIPQHLSESTVQSICKLNSDNPSDITQQATINSFENVIKPDPHLLIAGGGVDARPVVAMAKQLGWTVSVWDPRPANARREFFMEADYLLNNKAEQLAQFVETESVDMAVVMSHNVELDAAALAALNGSGIHFMALLGPVNRKEKVLMQAGLTEEGLLQSLSGPAGFDIGGELPESIALSMLSECHQRHYKLQSEHAKPQGHAPVSQEQAA